MFSTPKYFFCRNNHLQTSCELYKHPIREHIETRYNAVSKTENDVFSEKDFTIKAGNRCKLSLVFWCLFSDGQQGKNAQNTDCTEMMGLIGAGNNPQVIMTVAVAVAIEEASK